MLLGGMGPSHACGGFVISKQGEWVISSTRGFLFGILGFHRKLYLNKELCSKNKQVRTTVGLVGCQGPFQSRNSRTFPRTFASKIGFGDMATVSKPQMSCVWLR